MGDPYLNYIRTYGKVISGSRVVNSDFRHVLQRPFEFLFRERQIAVALGAQDGMADKPLRSRIEVLAEVRRLVG